MRATRRRLAPALLGAIVVLSAAWPGAIAAAPGDTIVVPARPYRLVFDPVDGLAYSFIGTGNQVVVIDIPTQTVLGTVNATSGNLQDLALDPAGGGVLGVASGRKLERFRGNLTSGTAISLPYDYAVMPVAASAALGRAYVRDVQFQGPGQYVEHLLAVDLASGAILADRILATTPTGSLVDDDAGRVYLSVGSGVQVWDRDLGGIIKTIAIPHPVGRLAIDPATDHLYVLPTGNGPVTIVDTTTDQIVGSLRGEGGAAAIAVDTGRSRVFVLRAGAVNYQDPNRGHIEVFEDERPVETIPAGFAPYDIALDATSGEVWVTDSAADVITIYAAGAASTAGFVTRDGGDLLVDGEPTTFVGANLYNANSDGYCRETVSDADLDEALVELHQVGSGRGLIRAWFFQTLATTKGTGQRDWSRFDRLVASAAARGYKIVPTLADQWGECGARVDPTYSFKTEAWYEGGYQVPDPGLAADYSGQWLSYRDWVEAVVERYKDDPTIAFWQLMNEAEVNPGGAFGACPPGDGPRDTLIDFATDMSARVKAIDQNHLLSLGTIGSGQCGTQGSQYQDVHAIADIDICEFHDYTPNQSIPGDQWNGLGVRVEQCAALDKPMLIGEMGMRPIDVGGTYEDRALAFQAKLVAADALDIDGLLIWNYWPDGPTLDNYDTGPDDPMLDMLVPTTPPWVWVVNTAGDPADNYCDPALCSLRGALTVAAGNGGIVVFDIPGNGPHRITPTTPLPEMTMSNVLIDGTSQPGFAAGRPVIEISGVDGPIGDGLVVSGQNVGIRGLVINGFGGASIRLTGGGSSLIVGNRLGTNVAGTAAVRHAGGLADSGILVEGGGDHQIGGATGGDPNLISGNDVGIRLTGTGTDIVMSQNVIWDNDVLGIDLGDDGVDGIPVTNQGGGPNQHQSAPSLDSVDADLDVVTGHASGIAGPMHVEIFASSACPKYDSGQGERYLGSVDVTASGTPPFATFEFTAPSWAPIGPDDVITATTTSSVGTSEFSGCMPFTAPGGDTPAGDDVVVQPVDESTGEAPVLIGFETVTSGGVTTLTTSPTAPPLPAGFQLGDPPTYFDISTTATYTGQVALCFDYSGFSYIDPASVRLYHYDAGLSAWQDVTESNDTDTHQICGNVTSLSPFALVQVTPTFSSSATATFTAGTSGSKSITTSGFVHPVLTATGDVPAGLSLHDNGNGTATLSGTPAAGSGGVHAVVLHGVEAGVEVTQTMQVTVREAASFTSPNSATFTLGAASTFQITLRGHPAPTLTKSGNLPNGLTFNATTKTVSGTAAPGTAGTYKLTLQASNGIGATAKQTLTITVGKRPTATVVTCTPDPSAPANGTTCRATISDTGGTGSSTPTGSPTWSVVTGSGSFSGASCANQAGNRVCTVTFTPGLTQSADQRVKAAYGGDTNHAGSTGEASVRLLVAVADAYNATLNTTLSVAAPGVLSNDRNSTGGTVSLIGGPAHGTLTLAANGSFTYKPAKNYKGKDGFIYRVKVGAVWSLPTVVTITVR